MAGSCLWTQSFSPCLFTGLLDLLHLRLLLGEFGYFLWLFFLTDALTEVLVFLFLTPCHYSWLSVLDLLDSVQAFLSQDTFLCSHEWGCLLPHAVFFEICLQCWPSFYELAQSGFAFEYSQFIINYKHLPCWV